MRPDLESEIPLAALASYEDLGGQIPLAALASYEDLGGQIPLAASRSDYSTRIPIEA
jgi:hypothetical protein